MKLKYFFTLLFLVANIGAMSPQVAENSIQAIADCRKRADDFNSAALSVIEKDYSVIEIFEQEAEEASLAIDKLQLKDAGISLTKDIEALMQRYPDNKDSLRELARERYLTSYNNKCKQVFGKFSQEKHPEMQFYSWMQDTMVKYPALEKSGDFSGKHLTELKRFVDADNALSNDHKMCLRELMTYFESPYSQQTYDAYLAGSIDTLVISRENHTQLLDMYTSIMDKLADLA